MYSRIHETRELFFSFFKSGTVFKNTYIELSLYLISYRFFRFVIRRLKSCLACPSDFVNRKVTSWIITNRFTSPAWLALVNTTFVSPDYGPHSLNIWHNFAAFSFILVELSIYLATAFFTNSCQHHCFCQGQCTINMTGQSMYCTYFP